MKIFLQILFFCLLFLTSTFPQDKFYGRVIPERLDIERILEILNSNTYRIQGLNDLESLLLKSKSSNWQTTLKSLKREFFEEQRFNAKDTRTTTNKVLLDNGFLLIEMLGQDWDGSNWVNYDLYTCTYDVNNNLIEDLFQTWDDSNWLNRNKTTYTYGVNNNLIEELIQGWDGSNWVNQEKYTCTYDVNNNMIELLSKYWDGSNWANYHLYTYSYDVNNNKIQELYQTWNGSNWVNRSKTTYTYDVNNNMIEELLQGWNGSNWQTLSKITCTYDVNNNLIEELIQTRVGSNWVNLSKYTYTYDVNNNMIQELYQTWNISNWVNYDLYTCTYDVNNNLIEKLRQHWDDANWVNSFKFSYTYTPVVALKEDINSLNSYNLSNNYPNPFNPSTKIRYTIPKRTTISLKIYNLLGSEVSELVKSEVDAGKYEVIFNAANLPSGVYFYRLKAGSFIDTKKMILLK